MAALVLARPGPEAEQHRQGCARCSADAATAQTVAGRLASYQVPPPVPGDVARTLEAAGPLLAHRAAQARARRHRQGWAIALSAALLPAVLLADLGLVRMFHAVLAPLLPPALSAYLVVSFGALLALLLAMACGTVPLVAARQSAALDRLEEVHV
jgi:hypothetical protein